MSKNQLIWAIISASFILSLGAIGYTREIDKTLSNHSEAQAGSVLTKADFIRAEEREEANFSRLEQKVDAITIEMVQAKRKRGE